MGDSPAGPWQPRYALTPAMARRLMEIEVARAVVEQVPLPPAIQSEMRNRERLRATHYSTRIEGNRLTLAEAERVLAGRKVPLHGRERDAGEVRSYWKALLRVEEWAARGAEPTEEWVQRIHALVEGRARPSRQERITASEVARLLGLADRTARLLLQKWTEDGWLVVADPSRRGRVYELSASYRQFIGNLTAEDVRE